MNGKIQPTSGPDCICTHGALGPNEYITRIMSTAEIGQISQVDNNYDIDVHTGHSRALVAGV